jgi:hypothetical protein
MAKKPVGMPLTTLKVLKYKGCSVYIRQLGHKTFEYLLIYKGQLFQGHTFWDFRKGEDKHTVEDISKIVGIMLSGAVATINELKKPREKSKMN